MPQLRACCAMVFWRLSHRGKLCIVGLDNELSGLEEGLAEPLAVSLLVIRVRTYGESSGILLLPLVVV
jgi:hypothetical protein